MKAKWISVLIMTLFIITILSACTKAGEKPNESNSENSDITVA